MQNFSALKNDNRSKRAGAFPNNLHPINTSSSKIQHSVSTWRLILTSYPPFQNRPSNNNITTKRRNRLQLSRKPSISMN